MKLQTALMKFMIFHVCRLLIVMISCRIFLIKKLYCDSCNCIIDCSHVHDEVLYIVTSTCDSVMNEKNVLTIH